MTVEVYSNCKFIVHDIDGVPFMVTDDYDKAEEKCDELIATFGDRFEISALGNKAK